jgi:hypothetical protein
MPQNSNPKIASVDPVLSIPDAAASGSISLWTLKRAAKRGELKLLQLSPRRIGIRQSELQRWLENRPRWGSPADFQEPSPPRALTAAEVFKVKPGVK